MVTITPWNWVGGTLLPEPSYQNLGIQSLLVVRWLKPQLTFLEKLKTKANLLRKSFAEKLRGSLREGFYKVFQQKNFSLIYDSTLGQLVWSPLPFLGDHSSSGT